MNFKQILESLTESVSEDEFKKLCKKEAEGWAKDFKHGLRTKPLEGNEKVLARNLLDKDTYKLYEKPIDDYIKTKLGSEYSLSKAIEYLIPYLK